MLSEVQLFEQCKKSQDLYNLETYIQSFPQGEHIVHVKGWYKNVLLDSLKTESPAESYRRHLQKRNELDIMRKNDPDANAANYWSMLIQMVMQQADECKSRYVAYLTEQLGQLSAREYVKLLDRSLLTNDDFDHIGITPEQVKQLESVSRPISINIEPLDEERYNNNDYRITEKCTEIYFWGMPAAGKSCCLSAILSTVETQGLNSGFNTVNVNNSYFEHLCNIFKKGNSISTLMEGTNENSIACAPFRLTHKKHGQRAVCLIDLAGETFKSMRAKNNAIELDEVRQLCLNVTTSYLTNEANRKLHFFVIPYVRPGHEKLYDGVSTSDYLRAGAWYLQHNKIIRKSTDGIYIVVTKADLMDCPKENYQENAEKYIRDSYSSFLNTMEEVCRDNGIGKGDQRVKILPFSIGRMITRETCIFDQSGAEAMINLICEKSERVMGRFGSLFNKLVNI